MNAYFFFNYQSMLIIQKMALLLTCQRKVDCAAKKQVVPHTPYFDKTRFTALPYRTFVTCSPYKS